MKKHTKVYMKHFGHTTADFIYCEFCGSKAVDIHHIKPRGMGGSKEADKIENLMALCRQCHEKYGDKKGFNAHLQQIHNAIIKIKSSI